MEVEVRKHAELKWGVCTPVRTCLADSDCVEVVQADFHGEKTDDETNGIESGATLRDRRRGIVELVNVVVEGQNRAGQVQGRVQSVGEVVAEVVQPRRRGESHTVTFREVGRIKLFLLYFISISCEEHRGSRGILSLLPVGYYPQCRDSSSNLG